MPALAMWQQFSSRYAYNKTSCRHLLKSGRAYKSAFAANPDNFVESATMVETEAIHHANIPVQPVSVVVPPLSLAPIRQPNDDQALIETQRALVQQLIRDELKSNPKPYEGKQTEDLDVLFRQLLVAKLIKAKPTNTINKSTNPVKLAPKKPQLKFKVVEPQIEQDQDVTDEDEEE